MNKLKKRWGITSNWQFYVIFTVFALTGSASAFLSKPVTNYIGLTKDSLGYFYLPVRLLLIFPIYQLLLVFIGYLFGQFSFFWTFEKKLLRRIKLSWIADFFEKK
jgi:manganese efflux pump family protein